MSYQRLADMRRRTEAPHRSEAANYACARAIPAHHERSYRAYSKNHEAARQTAREKRNVEIACRNLAGRKGLSVARNTRIRLKNDPRVTMRTSRTSS